MKNYHGPGDVQAFTAPAGGVVAGTCYIIGTTPVVASETKAAGETFQGMTVGEFDLAKAAAVTPAAGGNAYLIAASSTVTTASAGNWLIGFFSRAALAGDDTTRVTLRGKPAAVSA